MFTTSVTTKDQQLWGPLPHAAEVLMAVQVALAPRRVPNGLGIGPSTQAVVEIHQAGHDPGSAAVALKKGLDMCGK